MYNVKQLKVECYEEEKLLRKGEYNPSGFWESNNATVDGNELRLEVVYFH